jgi:PAS domain S-box-containing protein
LSPAGQPTLIGGMAIDITERKMAEDALRASEERRQLAQNAGNVGIFDWDIVGDKTYWSETMWSIYGEGRLDLNPDESFWGEHLHPDDAERVKLNIHNVVEGKDEDEFRDEYRIVTNDGAIRWIEAVAEVSRDAEGKAIRMYGVNLDITDKKNQADELQRAHDELEVRVAARTVELADVNKKLRAENAQRLRVEREAVRLLKQIVTIQEEERTRIARDLHDELGQRLTALRLKLKAARDLCKEKQVSDEIDATQAIAEQIDADVGFLAWELRPAALADAGLPATLDSYIKEWRRFSSVKAELHAKGFNGVRLAPETEINLYRIVQEALNNVHKYARAQNASVLIEQQKYDISLIIEDDGVGFDPEKKSARRNGLGLTGMRERAALLGGRIEIESSPGAGTTIFVRVPKGARDHD